MVEKMSISAVNETTAMSDVQEMKWYIVHTYSGHENKAKLSLLERIKNASMQESFGEILIPSEQVFEMVKGQRRTATRKFFPGYMFVHMLLNKHTFHVVKNTPKITGFLGGIRPTPVPEEQIFNINEAVTDGTTKPKPKVDFQPGESVRVVEGPFASFIATVEEIKPDKQKIKVLVSMFGRPTLVELDFSQVEKS